MACALTQPDFRAAEIKFSIDAFLEREREKDLLRFSTAGSVDDGKSTLIGRLLYDTQSVYDDQVLSIRGKGSTTGGQLDFALLTDGLRAEREQGITIDVAYRYFSTPRRKFIIADTPGHQRLCWWTHARACCHSPGGMHISQRCWEFGTSSWP
jgi:translation elongation factor EF-4